MRFREAGVSGELKACLDWGSFTPGQNKGEKFSRLKYEICPWMNALLEVRLLQDPHTKEAIPSLRALCNHRYPPLQDLPPTSSMMCSYICTSCLWHSVFGEQQGNSSTPQHLSNFPGLFTAHVFVCQRHVDWGDVQGRLESWLFGCHWHDARWRRVIRKLFRMTLERMVSDIERWSWN